MNCLITIAMALYRPNLTWLKEELDSLRRQSFSNFQILVWNDCPEDSFDYARFFHLHLSSQVPFKIFHGKHNLGSNKAFEKLTMLTNTPYIAYCDQDDIWDCDKLRISFELIQQKEFSLVYSDVSIIDRNSNLKYEDISYVRPRQKFYSHEVLKHLLAKNFVTGCTILMPTLVAKSAIPFPRSVFHDWWLAVIASIEGEIKKAPVPLVKYRIYENNQSGILKDVNDKYTYYKNYILKYNLFINDVKKKYPFNEEVRNYFNWSIARKSYFEHPSFSSARSMLFMRKFVPETVWLELILPWMPDWIFKQVLYVVKGK